MLHCIPPFLSIFLLKEMVVRSHVKTVLKCLPALCIVSGKLLACRLHHNADEHLQVKGDVACLRGTTICLWIHVDCIKHT